jgi:hypothetical protein
VQGWSSTPSPYKGGGGGIPHLTKGPTPLSISRVGAYASRRSVILIHHRQVALLQSHLKSERVRSVEEGPSSRRRSFIEITPTLGLDEPASNVVPFGSVDP